MAIDRFYEVNMTIRVPLDHNFPQEVRNAVAGNFRDEVTVSDLVLEEIRQMLEAAMLPVESIAAALNLFRVYDEHSNIVMKEVEVRNS